MTVLRTCLTHETLRLTIIQFESLRRLTFTYKAARCDQEL